MRCYICDRILDEENVQYNEEHHDYDPCPSCLAVIEDLVAGFGDRPVVAEDEFGFLDGWLGLDIEVDALHDPMTLDDLYSLEDPYDNEDFT